MNTSAAYPTANTQPGFALRHRVCVPSERTPPGLTERDRVHPQGRALPFHDYIRWDFIGPSCDETSVSFQSKIVVNTVIWKAPGPTGGNFCGFARCGGNWAQSCPPVVKAASPNLLFLKGTGSVWWQRTEIESVKPFIISSLHVSILLVVRETTERAG